MRYKKYIGGRESVQCCVTAIVKVLTETDGEDQGKNNVMSLFVPHQPWFEVASGRDKAGSHLKNPQLERKTIWIKYGEIRYLVPGHKGSYSKIGRG